MITIKDGLYAYRFTGNTMDRMETVYLLNGMGTLEVRNIVEGVKISNGTQRSAALPFVCNQSNIDDIVVNARHTFDGTAVREGVSELWAVKLNFKGHQFDRSGKPVGDGQIITGEYAMVPSGSQDTYWLMSMGPIDKYPPTITRAEISSGEIHKIGNLPKSK